MDRISILHTADLHLGSPAEAHLSGKAAGIPAERRGELLAVFADIVDSAKEEGASAVLMSGDLSDRGVLPHDICGYVLETVRANPALRFFFVPGNHDLTGGSSAEGCFPPHTDIPSNLTVFGREWSTVYLSPSVTVSGRILPPEAGDLSVPVLPEDCYNIVLLHGMLGDGLLSGGADCMISRKALAGKHIDYLALGHLHTFSHEKLDERGIACYSGTPAGRGWDECGEKGWVLLTVSDGVRRGARFVPSGARTLHTVSVPVTDVPSGLAATEEAVFSALAGIPARDLVRVVLSGEDDPAAERGISYLKARLAERYYDAVLEDERVTRLDWERYRGDISLKGAFVRAVTGDRTLSEEEKEEIVRCGLCALLGREL